jgi:hypothetical protein
MDEENLIRALESVNEDYLRILYSSEYRTGKRIKKIAHAIKHGNPREIVGFITSMQVQKKVQKISEKKKNPIICIDKPATAGALTYQNRRVSVYTCITGGYDQPVEPIYCPNTENFVLFSDDLPLGEESEWHRISLDKVTGLQPGMNANRYCKMHPYAVFPEDDYSIYLDGNMQVVSDLTALTEIARKSKVGIAMHKHPKRNCAYVEAEVCIASHRGNPEAINKQMKRYREDGFPDDFGFCEATVIVADLSNPIGKRILESWWEEFCRSGSGRDQLALPYVIWKNGFVMNDIGNLGCNLQFNPKFRIVNLGGHSFK